MRVLNKVFFQTLWQVLAKTVSSISTFIVLSVVARTYGEEGTGVYTLATTYIAMFFVIVDLGLNAYVLPKLSESEKEANKLFNFRLSWSLLLVVVANLIIWLFPIGNKIFNYSVLFGSITIVMAGVFNSLNLIFQKELKYQLSSLASAIGSVTLIPILLGLAFYKVPIEYLIFGTVGAWFFNNLASSLLVNKFYKFKLSLPDFSFIKVTFKNAWPISLTLIFNVVYFRIDAFILSSTRSLAEVGVYNLAFSLFQTALVIPTFIMNSYYPIIIEELVEKKVLFKQLKIGFLLMMGIAILGVFTTLIVSSPLIELLTGGGFEGSDTSLNILAFSFPAFFSSAYLMWILVSFKAYQKLLWIYAFGLSLNVGLNLWLTPQYSYLATSWITVFSEYVILLLQLLALPSVLKKVNQK